MRSVQGEFTIRRATPEDVEGIISCEMEVWLSLRGLLPPVVIEENLSFLSEPGAEEAVKSWLTDPRSIVFVASDRSGLVVGVARGECRFGGVAWLNFLCVRPRYRRRGIGSSLLSEFVEEARRRGMHKVSLYTSPLLKDAVKLYVSAGFIPEGFLRKHFYKMDLILYSLFL